MGKKSLFIAGFAALLLVIVSIIFLIPRRDTYIFPGLHGPDAATRILPGPPTPVDRYAGGGESRLAILLTDPGSPWLGLVHGLKSIGVPFTVTEDWREAVRHRVVLVYPEISGRRLTPDALRALASHPRSGGTLIGVNVLGGGLEEVFGFEKALPGRNRFEIRFAPEQPGGLTLLDRRERLISLGSGNRRGNALGTYGYTRPRSPGLAEYEDGTAAVTRREIGSGRAYAIGLDLGDFMLRGYNNRGEWIARSFVNEYGPSIDVLLRWLRHVYMEGEPNPVTIATVPDNRQLAVMMTHDVDYHKSMPNAVVYARMEKELGVPATYFLQTKYMRDYYDDIFFNDKTAPFVRELGAMGMELASHSVSHSRKFHEAPTGSGDERYPEYRPRIEGFYTTSGVTVLGELRVSRFLIEKVGGGRVVSFRPGHLVGPRTLPQALEASGYLYSSAATANTALTHLPFQLNYNRDTLAEVPVFEFPVTIEDEKSPSLLKRLPRAIDLARKLARYGGTLVVLIHTNETGGKLEFERRFLEAVRERAWIGRMDDFGAWWAARDKVQLDASGAGGEKTVSLALPSAIDRLTVQVPPAWKYTGCVPSGLMVSSAPGTVVLGKAQGRVSLSFVK